MLTSIEMSGMNGCRNGFSRLVAALEREGFVLSEKREAGAVELRMPSWDDRFFSSSVSPVSDETFDGPFGQASRFLSGFCADRMTVRARADGKVDFEFPYWSRWRAIQHGVMAAICLLPREGSWTDRMSFALLAQAFLVGSWLWSARRARVALEKLL